MNELTTSPRGLRRALDNGATPAAIAMVIAYDSGMHLREVGRYMGVTGERVRQCITPLVDRRPRGTTRTLPANDTHRYRLQELWALGKTAREIGVELGLTTESVGQLLHRGRKAGWTLPYRYSKARRSAAAKHLRGSR